MVLTFSLVDVKLTALAIGALFYLFFDSSYCSRLKLR